MIEFKNVSKAYDKKTVIHNVNLTIAQGKITVLIGSSGSGKSTALKLINRLEKYQRGQILLAGKPIEKYKLEELRRNMGYAIQHHGLFPHWNVADNIATVPRLLGWEKQKIVERIDQLLAALSLTPADYRQRMPHELSGGQMQRVGIARALAGDPDILLMDEPFGALDPINRAVLQQEFLRIHHLYEKTTLFITHDVDEALLLADHLVIMEQGEIIQQGSPRDILLHPKNEFIHQFLGGDDIGIKLLSHRTISEIMRSVTDREKANTHHKKHMIALTENSSIKQALTLMTLHPNREIDVTDQFGALVGYVDFSDLTKAFTHENQ
jgi:osmoprotectant transport system ATP-binding protein